MHHERKKKKVIAIIKHLPDEKWTLASYDCLLSLTEKTIDMIIGDLGISIDEIVPQLDLTMELELLKGSGV